MPDFSAALEKHFKAETFPRGKPLAVTLVGVVAEEVGKDKDVRPVAYFKEDSRGLILNKTTYDELSEAHQSRDTDTWEGALLELYHDPKVEFGGKKVGGVRLRVVKRAEVKK